MMTPEERRLGKEVERLEALVRRLREERDEALESLRQKEDDYENVESASCGPWYVDQDDVLYENRKVALPLIRRSMLLILVRRPGTVITKKMFWHQLYGAEPSSNVVEVHLSYLKKAIRLQVNNAPWIETVWGRGWRWNKNALDDSGRP